MAFPKHNRRTLSSGMLGIIAAVVIIVIIIAAYFAFSGGSSTYVSSSTNVTILPANSIYFSLPDSKNVYVLFLKSSAPSTATLYMSDLPVLASPIAVLQLGRGQSFNISADGSPIADLQIKLIGANATQSELELSFIPRLLNVKPSSGISYMSPTLTTGAATNQSNGTATTTVTTTGTTTAGSSSTTTIAATDYSAKAVIDANTTKYGILINEYKALYIKDLACTPGIYNTTFYAEEHQQAVPPNDFKNVSPTVITKITSSASVFSGNVYNITYIATAPSPEVGTLPILKVQLDVGTNTLVSGKFVGPFAGLNYTTVNNYYDFQANIGNDCGAYIP